MASVSEETKRLIRAHLQSCAQCRSGSKLNRCEEGVRLQNRGVDEYLGRRKP